MSILFPNVNKPKEWDYRPIYYDPEKDARREKLRQKRAEREQSKSGDEHITRLHHGSFREAHDMESQYTRKERRKSKLTFWIALLLLLLFTFYYIL